MSRSVAVAAAAASMLALTACTASGPAADPIDLAVLPHDPVFDYQLGGGYPPADDVTVVVRDRTDAPESGLYSICYINAFQTQPGELDDWPSDAVLVDDSGLPVRDPHWPDEALLDISSPAGKEIVVATVGDWIRGCAADGFDAVEFDNLDSFTRADGRIAIDDGVEVAARLVTVAHSAGLSAGQKNAAEFAAMLREEAHFDFAVSEECAAYDECSAYVETYGTGVLNIEYTDNLARPFTEVCADADTPPSTILRDRDLATPAEPAHRREVC
ncbi:endo alpha-1,4 polygalactosaminidase [Microbacterium shaanxiense]